MSKYKAELTFGLGNSKINSMNLEQQRYGRNKNTVINHTYIESGAYRRKFDKITDNKEVNRVLYLKAKEMLNHRSGTLFEDMYWIDADSGAVIASVLNEVKVKSVNYNAVLIKSIKNRNVITLHTHPHSFPPSIDDFNSAFKHDYKLCLVICHDGKVFKYGAYEECNKDLYLIKLVSFIQDGYNDYEAQVMTLNYMALFFNIWFEEV